MKKLLLGLSAAATMVFAGQAMAGGHAAKELIVSTWAAPVHTMNANVFPWMDGELQKCSGGSLSLKLEYNLAPPPAQYDTVRDGVADLTWIVHGYTPGKFATTKLAELPGNTGNAEQMSVAFQKTWEKYLSKAGEAKGVQVLANYVHGPGHVNTVKKITSYKEIEGMKLRVGGGVANDIGSALGVAGVNLPAPGVYEAVSSGVAEGVFFPIETMYAFKVAEVAKYTFRNPDGMYTTSFGLLMNDDSYNDLSDKHRKCIDDMRGVELSRKIGKYWDEADDLGYKKFAEMGGTVTDASPAERAYYKEKTSGIEAQIVAAASDRGVDGKAALAYYRSLLN